MSLPSGTDDSLSPQCRLGDDLTALDDPRMGEAAPRNAGSGGAATSRPDAPSSPYAVCAKPTAVANRVR